MDTGSTDLWVVDEAMKTERVKKFNPKASSTFLRTGSNWTTHYGSGASGGYVGQDIACIEPTEYCFPAQIFGVATQITEQVNSCT